MQDVFDFPWQVATEGYRWVRTKAAPPPLGNGNEGLFLTSAMPLLTPRSYSPLQEYPALFRSFIETAPTEDGILAFANQYGPLGGNISTRIFLPNHHVTQGELLGAWQIARDALKQAVTLWDMVEAGNFEGVAQHIVWKDKRVDYHSHPGRSVNAVSPVDVPTLATIASQEIRPDLLERFQEGEVGQPARYYVQEVINRHLEGRISPRLLWNHERTQLGLYHVPHGLIGALWLQFAQAIAGNKKYHQCKYCGTWIEMSLEASRPTRDYCSNACRFKAYRKRQEDAYRLSQEGIPLKEIAKRLGTDTATAKGWIKKRKEA